MAFLKMGKDLTNFAEVQGKLATASEENRELDAALTAANLRVAELEDENQRLDGQWLDGGSHPEDIEAGTRVHYHPIRGEPEHRAGKTRSKPRVNVNGFWVVHVDLDDGDTIYSAHIRHLRREPEEARLRARVAALDVYRSAAVRRADVEAERACAAEDRVNKLEHSLSDAMEQIEAIQGSNAVHMARVEELEEPQVGWTECPRCGMEHYVQLSRGRTNDPNKRGEMKR